jgi:allantoin racemase
MQKNRRKIAVLNPNSNAVFTESISSSLAELRQTRGVTIECTTLHGAPIAIESDEDINAVIAPICDVVENLEADVEGMVIACFADPGLKEARQIGSRVIVGSCEAAVLAAVQHGTRLGLISTGDDVDADRDLIHSYCANIEFLKIESLGIPTAEIPTDPSAMNRMVGCGESLQADGVDAIMLGCAGMAPYTDRLRVALDIPVIESASAAVEMLLDAIEIEGSKKYAND